MTACNPSLKTMDLIKLFEGKRDLCKKAIADFRAGKSAKEVASTHIEPNLRALQENAGQDLDSLHVAYMIEYIVTRSNGSKNPIRS